ncbi:sensor histidine kinase [Clostridium omnivorum]|uniref:histidine kinase n=1 Tax=Clostridium omnivorum TaxID=1604902 RepID=A0ABQ5N4E7_9CLOT|nr:ATP-binding protein [Clostridium sp. E14]GLC30075.1 hypothetical protein bsdE14_14850 [Clostridium sp. E14]
MLLKVFDILTTILQTLIFVWTPNSIASRDNKLSKVKYYAFMVTVFADIVFFTYSGINGPLANFLMMFVVLLLTIIFYRKHIVDGFLGFGLAYTIIVLVSYFLTTVYQNAIAKLSLPISDDLKLIFAIYIPGWILYFLVYKFRKYIFNTAISLKGLKHSLVYILLLDYALLFLDTLHMEWITESMGVMFKASLYLAAFIGFVFATVYYAKINDKSKEVELLNEALNEKITELKKIKHDYGSEISSLYGLYQMGKMDRIGALLKGIVERYQGVNPAINLSVQATPLVASVLNYAVNEGVNVIVFDGGDYDNLTITENELLKLLSNIVRNSVDVLKTHMNPTIKFKSYSIYEGVIISISNNGPEIPKEIKQKIFEAGFSTKDNKSGDRGFGLSIVADIMKKCNGHISIDSDKEWTEFKIEIPYKQ